MSKSVHCFYALLSFYLSRRIVAIIIFRPESCKSSLFLTFDFKFDESTPKLFSYVNVNLSIYKVSRFIEWKLSLYLDLSFREVAALITEEVSYSLHIKLKF
jgi:hypothetical protein